MSEQQFLSSGHRNADDSRAAPGTDPRVWLCSIAHDFNNFLTPIVTIMEELKRQEVGTAVQLRRIEAAIFCASRAETLARQLLDFGSPQRSVPAAVDVRQLVECVEPVLASVLPAKITLALEISDEPSRAFIDRKLIERALLNLVLNARDAMPDGGEIIISAGIDLPPGGADPHVNMVRLSVADTGIGMGEEAKESVGVPFYSTKIRGAGLGLAIVRQLMEAQGGKFSITSTMYHGTTVDLWLPLCSSGRADALATGQSIARHPVRG